MVRPVTSEAAAPRAAAGPFDRKLPQSVEAEQYVLGSMLIDETVVPGLLQFLQVDDFYSTRHQLIFRAIEEVYNELSTVDPVLIRDRLQKLGAADDVGGMDYFDEIMDAVTTVANADYHAREIRDKSILRRLIAKSTEIIQGAYDSEEAATVQLDRAEQVIMDIGHAGRATDFVELERIVDDIFTRFQEERSQGVMTGFVDLDRMTTGLHPSELVIVAGRPSMGKTTFAMNVVEAVARSGKSVAIFSLEVSKDQLVQNLLCSFARVDAQRFRQNELTESDWQALVDAADKLRELNVHVDDTSSLNPLSLKAKARRLFARKAFDLIVIDYLQLMEGTRSSESRQQEVSMISRSLKALARELSVPVITISQLSRGVENRESHRPRLSDLRESGAIEQDADLVLLLYREEYYKPDREEARGKAEVIVAKQRNGPTGTVELAFRNRFMRFDNLSHHHGEAY